MFWVSFIKGIKFILNVFFKDFGVFQDLTKLSIVDVFLDIQLFDFKKLNHVETFSTGTAAAINGLKLNFDYGN